MSEKELRSKMLDLVDGFGTYLPLLRMVIEHHETAKNGDPLTANVLFAAEIHLENIKNDLYDLVKQTNYK